ncbi:hypothetical protein [Methylocaldum sp.]|uniref:hypothetical protein n=1 Tax=Methylocaldum sp. TaxID=1969727 RepID=UPI002D389C7D|nr:hypothetical protein [Methylocaldum sp.]HYE33990.1 hypothetical protein [Methylocaldum sp.]
MARLIEVQDPRMCLSPLTVRSGDVLLFRAAGGRVRSGGDVVELLGPFLQAVVGDDGNILTPMGPPNTVLFHARQPGRALIDVITGDLFHTPQTTALGITVEA